MKMNGAFIILMGLFAVGFSNDITQEAVIATNNEANPIGPSDDKITQKGAIINNNEANPNNEASRDNDAASDNNADSNNDANTYPGLNNDQDSNNEPTTNGDEGSNDGADQSNFAGQDNDAIRYSPKFCDKLKRSPVDLLSFLRQFSGKLIHVASLSETERLCSTLRLDGNQVHEQIEKNRERKSGHWVACLEKDQSDDVWKKTHLSPKDNNKVGRVEFKKIYDHGDGYIITYVCDCDGSYLKSLDVYATDGFNYKSKLAEIVNNQPNLLRGDTVTECKNNRREIPY